ncbi:DUF6538 domain-containing protein [Novosphingobium meiothermophilum]|uniref:DUF6538 domain-containing protein n=1 Tax=Novosphingobium meiothermophilum TaxID=2202251 RepID=UPI000D6E17B0|nr:DUF6538 domain-containing protein [Novosphingobium meiothermophilum]
MTAWAAPFLMRRGLAFYVRVRIPGDLVNLVGVREVRRSLGPMRFHEARQLAARTGSQLKDTFAMMRNANNLSKNDIRNLIRDCFAELEKDRDRGFEPVTSEPDFEVLDQESMAKDHLRTLKHQLSAGAFEADTIAAAKQMAARQKIDLDDASDEKLKAIVEGVVRAMIEAEQLYLFRLGEADALLTVPTISDKQGVRRGVRCEPVGPPVTANEIGQQFQLGPVSCQSLFGPFDLLVAAILFNQFIDGELIQLHFTDCVLDGPVPYISINEESDAKHGEDGYKHVKSDAGVRKIPLHPDIMALWFADFVKRQRKMAGSPKRVFHRIKFGMDGQPSTVFSKWFGRFLDKIGLDDPALVFHSFRHSAEDYLRTNKVPKYIIDQIIGHQDHSSGGDYGFGLSFEDLHEVIASLKLPVRVPELIEAAAGSQ